MNSTSTKRTPTSKKTPTSRASPQRKSSKSSESSQNDVSSQLSHLQSMLKRQQETTANLRKKLETTSAPLINLNTSTVESHLDRVSSLLSRYSSPVHTPSYHSPIRNSLSPEYHQVSPTKSPSSKPIFDHVSNHDTEDGYAFLLSNDVSETSLLGRTIFQNSKPNYEKLYDLYMQLEAENVTLKEQIRKLNKEASDSNTNQSNLLKATLNELSVLMDRIGILERELKQSRGKS
ncbi:hypothetical protein RCL1_005305 [Eukaryota sp. TZLM3-RCL]